MDVKLDKTSNLAVVERNPSGNIQSVIAIPANDWQTYNLTHTTTTNSTTINFFINPTLVNTVIYVDNVQVSIQ